MKVLSLFIVFWQFFGKSLSEKEEYGLTVLCISIIRKGYIVLRFRSSMLKWQWLTSFNFSNYYNYLQIIRLSDYCNCGVWFVYLHIDLGTLLFHNF